MTVQGLNDLQRKIKRMESKLDSDPKQSVRRGLARTEKKAQQKIADQDAVASGELIGSFEQAETPLGGKGTRFTLRNTAPHAALVEFGTGGFHVPNPWTERYSSPTMTPMLVQEIKEWIIQKPSMILYTDVDTAAQAIAHVIAMGSDTRPPGTPAQRFFQPAWFETELAIKRNVRSDVRKAVRRS